MTNEKIGAIGEAFIQRQLESCIGFDSAWDAWQAIQAKLLFIMECPEVQHYDDRRICDSRERQRLRQISKARMGKHIRSADVSQLGRIAAWLQMEVPVRPYHMDRDVVAEWLAGRAERLELEYGMDETVAEARKIADSEDIVEAFSVDMEQFSERHSLWAVPPRRLIQIYVRHLHGMHEASFLCNGCNEEIVVPVGDSAETWQPFKVACPKCCRLNKAYMSIDDMGEGRVVWDALDSDPSDG